MEVKGPNSVEVTWQAPPLVHHNGAILSYIIRYFPSNDLDRIQDTHVTVDKGGAIQNRTLSNLEPFTRYTFKVSAVNAVGAGPFSMVVERTTAEDGEWSANDLCEYHILQCICPPPLCIATLQL